MEKMGKLDAIFAKLKNKQISENVKKDKETENNNTKDLANLNQNFSEVKGFSIKNSPSPMTIQSGTSRRKSRKSRPRNILEFDHVEKLNYADIPDFDDDGKWNIDVRNGSECDDTEDVYSSRVATRSPSPQPLDLSSGDHGTSSFFHDTSTEDSSEKLIIDESLNDDSSSVPLDLSVKDSKRITTATSSYSNQTAESQSTATDFSKTSIAADKSSVSTPVFPPDSTDAKLLKDYANNTMNELLKLYGLGSPTTKTADSNEKLQLTKYHVAQLAATSNLGLIPNELKGNGATTSSMVPSSGIPIPPTTVMSGVFPGTRKGIYSGQRKPMFQQNGFFKPNAKSNSSPKFRKILPGVKTALYANKTLLPDYTKYLKRFCNGAQCGSSTCKELGYREHYHCLDCSRVYVKKEEMVRHFKWHKKREESLQHGFMRYSPMDNCKSKFGTCTHNGRQTHYHCIQAGCDKVYISTSDVQMHANYHRKDSAIIHEGFQRFRATEDCGTTACQFYGQRTTHFHCRRSGCNFTFKNKADMEKHKTYHQKDEILSKDGFKKFMKYENCLFTNCKYAKISNHIHCIRPGCDYVLHSTAQLYSHKRKHERRDFESAYQTFRQTQDKGGKIIRQVHPTLTKSGPATQIVTSIQPAPIATDKPMSLPVKINQQQNISTVAFPVPFRSTVKQSSINSNENTSRETTPVKDLTTEQSSVLRKFGENLSGEKLNDSLTLPIPRIEVSSNSTINQPVSSVCLTPVKDILVHDTSKLSERKDKDESWRNYLVRYTANDPCNSRCSLLYKDHYHCQVESCNELFRAKDAVREHAKFHEQQDRITPMVYDLFEINEDCNHEDCEFNGNIKHYHCNWTGCDFVIQDGGGVFNRLEHYRIHEYTKTTSCRSSKSLSEEDVSKRRRGRPPKFPGCRIPSVPKVNLSDNEINDSVIRYIKGDVDDDSKIINGFRKFEASESCLDDLCLFLGTDHYHCARNRCHHATDRLDVLNLHTKDFHTYVKIVEGFEYFDQNVNCRRKQCHNNKTTSHFHCTRNGCDYSFVRHSTMSQHEKKHHSNSSIMNTSTLKTSSNYVPIVPHTPSSLELKNKNIVKAAGTFYPLSGLNNNNVSALVSVSYPNLVSLSQPLLASTTSLLATSPSAIVPFTVPLPGLGLVPQLLVPSGQALQSLVPMTSDNIPTSSSLPVSLQQKPEVESDGNEPTWSELKNTMHFSNTQNCCRPFCKLKKKDHYHCVECNQTFSDPVRLQTHIVKHGINFKQSSSINNGLDLSSPAKRIKCTNEDLDTKIEGEVTSSSLNLNPDVFSNMWKCETESNGTTIKIKKEKDIINDISLGNGEDQDNPHDLSKWSGRKRTSTRHEDFIDSDTVSSPSKVQKLSSPKTSRVKVESDSNVLKGFEKFRYNEDCEHEKCAYKHSSTHYHCIRSDCGYGFSDRSRLVQHTARHERIDKIMGDEFRQFRASVNCYYEDCEFSSKATHFHCLKCLFACADSSKVSAHRKYHIKLHNISSKGFVKFVGSQDCEIPFCPHSKKQTHYHCTFQNCNHAVLGPAQMAPHKLKHSIKEKRQS